MTETGTWSPYVGSAAFVLAAVLFIIAGALTYLGTRLHHPVGTRTPGRALGILFVLMWVLAFFDLGVAGGAIGRVMTQQRGPLTAAPNPIAPITTLSAVGAFAAVTYFSREHGLKTAFGSAIVSAIAGTMIFELPFDLIIMSRISYFPTPIPLYALLYFLPLFLWELASFCLLTLSPLMKLSRYTLFSLAAMFFVFAVWALFGFPDPSSPLPIALNAISKVLAFVAAATLFLPEQRMGERTITQEEVPSLL